MKQVKQVIKSSYQLQVQLFTFTLMFALFLMPEMAFAQDGGFAGTASSMLDDIALGIQIVVGVVATIALMCQFAEGYMCRKTWADIFTTSAWIIGAGAAINLAIWIFGAGQKISFG